MRVPVLVGHLEAVWIETEDALSPDDARSLLGSAPGVRVVDIPSPAQAAGIDDVLVGRVRRDPAADERPRRSWSPATTSARAPP